MTISKIITHRHRLNSLSQHYMGTFHFKRLSHLKTFQSSLKHQTNFTRSSLNTNYQSGSNSIFFSIVSKHPPENSIKNTPEITTTLCTHPKSFKGTNLPSTTPIISETHPENELFERRTPFMGTKTREAAKRGNFQDGLFAFPLALSVCVPWLAGSVSASRLFTGRCLLEKMRCWFWAVPSSRW